MVRDVRYITLNSSYRDLQEMLLTGQLKTLALVESRGRLVLVDDAWPDILREILREIQ